MKEFEKPEMEFVVFRADAVVTSWQCVVNCDAVCGNDSSLKQYKPDFREIS